MDFIFLIQCYGIVRNLYVVTVRSGEIVEQRGPIFLNKHFSGYLFIAELYLIGGRNKCFILSLHTNLEKLDF
jgi:hypothetical protein